MEKRSSPLCTAVRSRRRHARHLHLPSAQRRLGSGHCRTMRGCDLHFVPSQPPQGGAMNARAASVLRTTVSAGNPGHNITHYCVTGRGCKPRLFSLRTQQDVMLSASVRASLYHFPYAPPGRSRRQARSFAPGPSPALARRKTPHLAGPRPQGAAPRERR